jgi:hypothetical protein
MGGGTGLLCERSSNCHISLSFGDSHLDMVTTPLVSCVRVLIHFVRVSVICTFGSMVAWFVWMLFIGSFPHFITDGTMYQVPMHVFVDPTFWLSVVVVSMLCVGTSLGGLYYLRTYLLFYCAGAFLSVFLILMLMH